MALSPRVHRIMTFVFSALFIVGAVLAIRDVVGKKKAARQAEQLEAIKKDVTPAIKVVMMVVQAVGDRNLALAYSLLDTSLQQVWPKDDFIRLVSDLRNRTGDRWQPSIVLCQRGESNAGPMWMVHYRLVAPAASSRPKEPAGAAAQTYGMRLDAVKMGDSYKVVQWMMERPCDRQDVQAGEAQNVAQAFFPLVKQEKFVEAQALMVADMRTEQNLDALRQLRLGLQPGVELRSPVRKIINGSQLYSVTAMVGDNGSNVELLVSDVGAETKIAALTCNLQVKKPDSPK